MNRKAETDWIGLAILLIMLTGAVMVSYQLITRNINSCTKNPIEYYLRDYEVTTNYSLVDLKVFLHYNDVIPILHKELYNRNNPRPPINFTEHNITFVQPLNLKNVSV